MQRDGGILIYEDEASSGQAGSRHRTWAKRGKGGRAKTFPVAKGREVMGAVRVGNKLGRHFRFIERYNKDTFTAVIEQLLRYYKGKKVHLVVDDAPRHKTKSLRKWLEEIKDLIEVHFLPNMLRNSMRPSISGRRYGNGLPTTASSRS